MSSHQAQADGTPAPVREGERLDLLDALRGFALAGVLLANLRDYSLFNLLDDDGRAALPSASVDRWLAPLLDALIGGKAMTLFALLFGIGFALQLHADRDNAARWRYARRMGALFAFGALHAWLFWWGDILRYYALFGLLLLACARWPARRLLVAGLFVTLIATPLLQPWMTGWSARFGDRETLIASTLVAFTGNDWPRMLAANVRFDLYMHGTAWSLVFFTLGRLLLGAALGRSGWLFAPERHSRQWRGMLLLCLPTGLLLTAFFALQDASLMPRWMFGLEGTPARMLARLLRSAAYLLTGLGYLAAFVLAWARPRWMRRLAVFAPVGRMALTHYLTQTAVCVALFYGFGLGIGPRFGMPGILLVFGLVFAAQLALSRWWLARFRFGPFKWLWRGVTYGRLQPWRRGQPQR